MRRAKRARRAAPETGATLRVVSDDRPGVLMGLTAAVSDVGANIRKATVRSRSPRAMSDFVVEGSDAQVQEVIRRMGRVKGVVRVERI